MIRVRPAHLCDAARVAELATQLGYPATTTEMLQRLAGLIASQDDVVLVADDGNAQGWIHAREMPTLTDPGRIEVCGLVVDAEQRHRGIGRILIHAVTDWARARGGRVLKVRSNVLRERSREFYIGLGFTLAKSQHTFRMALRTGEAEASRDSAPEA